MNTFERNEKKYILPKNDFMDFVSDLSLYMNKDRYFQYTIYNLYLDDDHFGLISRSLEKPIYKEKVRYRKYDKGEAFIEIKKKFNKVVYKRRTTIEDTTSQISKEINYVIAHYQLEPKIFIAYDRYAYISKDQIDLRITFDHHLRYRFSDLTLQDTIENEYYMKDEFYIMEIKFSQGMPLWLSHLLNEYHLYPTSFSKYGKIIQREKERLHYV